MRMKLENATMSCKLFRKQRRHNVRGAEAGPSAKDLHADETHRHVTAGRLQATPRMADREEERDAAAASSARRTAASGWPGTSRTQGSATKASGQPPESRVREFVPHCAEVDAPEQSRQERGGNAKLNGRTQIRKCPAHDRRASDHRDAALPYSISLRL